MSLESLESSFFEENNGKEIDYSKPGLVGLIIKKPYKGIIGQDPIESSQEQGQKQFNQIVDYIEKEIQQEDS